MKKIFSVILVAFLGVLTYLVYALAEPQEIHSNGILARLLVPGAVRNFQWPELCSEVRLSRSFQECTAGICGEHYDTHFRSASSSEMLEIAFAKFMMQVDTTDTILLVDDEVAQDGCRSVRVSAYFSYYPDTD